MFPRNLTRLCQRSFSTSFPASSGHSKWAKIKQRKGINDAQKSAIYGRASRASGGKDKGNQLATYEAMAHGSVGVLIECLTDNGNRTLHNLRSILNKHNARYATVGFMFQRKGCVRVAVDAGQVEALIDAALEADAEDFEEQNVSEESVEIQFICPTQSLTKLTEAVMSSGRVRELLTSELIYVPTEASESTDEELESRVGEMVYELEENEDILRRRVGQCRRNNSSLIRPSSPSLCHTPPRSIPPSTRSLSAMSESASPLASPAPEEATIQKKAPRSRSSRSTGKKEVKEKKKITAKKPVYKKSVEEKSATHPSWKDIIKECIAANPEDARSGVSRSTLKKFAEDKYNLDMSGGNLFQLNRAITTGAEQGVFSLPKGPSGKIKLAPKRPRTAAATEMKENNKPTSSNEESDGPAKKPKAPKKLVEKKTAKAKAVAAPATKAKTKAKAPAAKKPAPKTKTAPAAAPKKAKEIVPLKKTVAPKKVAAIKKPAEKAKKTSTAKSSEKKVAAAKAAATKATKTKAAASKTTKTRAGKKTAA
ncbi:hypothetical protein HETIRDRAFT_457373 [Heterobasidion irregulare TC 32-1]|uniref:Histone H1 n=1 Tax=Heterobasidion irregulare (strain TC 32-1) TaxID=747525 RepID=W4KIJ1_HETIT|nr:uncharacterized protein HETIRDRAFT_457373 [Heterobasidion irregulare TC 32-1]ETW85524.1 hypothetical protein HETIRDRAFT_457373 [Heterobasidion irregulare TC 32-1]